jgi:hypothetical protein
MAAMKARAGQAGRSDLDGHAAKVEPVSVDGAVGMHDVAGEHDREHQRLLSKAWRLLGYGFCQQKKPAASGKCRYLSHNAGAREGVVDRPQQAAMTETGDGEPRQREALGQPPRPVGPQKAERHTFAPLSAKGHQPVSGLLEADTGKIADQIDIVTMRFGHIEKLVIRHHHGPGDVGGKRA